MSSSITLAAEPQSTPRLPLPLLRTLRDALHGRLAALRTGQLLISGPDGFSIQLGAKNAPSYSVTIKDDSFYAYAALGGSTGVGQAWILGLWDTTDLVGLTRLMLRERDTLNSIDSGIFNLKAPIYRFMEWRRRNSLDGSRRNIAAHYDLGNDFFQLFLDESMTYSAGVFASEHTTLAAAQQAKYRLICEKLRLQPGQEVIEIGSGWGGFAIHAARHFGVKVTTTTISQQQFDLASQRIREAGLEDQITILMSDYRDLQGQYDKLVSIEMIEAVGHQYLPTYFSKIDDLLKPDGEAVIQAITIQDQNYDDMRKGTDFIRQFIFPGGHLPCVTEMTRVTTQNTSLRLFDLDDFGQDYARTLHLWRERFHQQLSAVAAQGYNAEFRRMWDFYLASCEAGFLEATTSVVHAHFTKPRCLRENRHFQGAAA